MSGHTLEPVEASIRCHIPMDYLERHGADTIAAMRDYAEDRWTLIERLRTARERQSELLEALEAYADTLCEFGRSNKGCGKFGDHICFGCRARAAVAKAKGEDA